MESKAEYIYDSELEAARLEINAKLAAKNGKDARAMVASLNADADAIDASIKAEAEKEEKGYWLCANGHESAEMPNMRPVEDRPANLCVVNVNGKECGGEVKLIKRDQMTGQEKYESDKERKEAEAIATSKRGAAHEREEFAQGAEKTAIAYEKQAAQSRALADKIKHL